MIQFGSSSIGLAACESDLLQLLVVAMYTMKVSKVNHHHWLLSGYAYILGFDPYDLKFSQLSWS